MTNIDRASTHEVYESGWHDSPETNQLISLARDAAEDGNLELANTYAAIAQAAALRLIGHQIEVVASDLMNDSNSIQVAVSGHVATD